MTKLIGAILLVLVCALLCPVVFGEMLLTTSGVVFVIVGSLLGLAGICS